MLRFKYLGGVQVELECAGGPTMVLNPNDEFELEEEFCNSLGERPDIEQISAIGRKKKTTNKEVNENDNS